MPDTQSIRLDVETPSRSYPIHIGSKLIQRSGRLIPALDGPKVIVTNETIAPLYLDSLEEAIGGATHTFVMPDGERFKSIDTCMELVDVLLQNKLGRDSVLVALGGGVVGDLTGFAAAIYQRGINFIQVPTTLLAQVDSSVGGKTAVNRALGKNMVGAFHQPLAVIADLTTLTTLPPREYLAGMAEVIKYGLLGDADFFEWIEAHLTGLLDRDTDLMAEAVRRSCDHKARIVAADERESGVRALLNLGHTFGHAIEAHLEFEGWLHGEAVATGMLMAAHMSVESGTLDTASRERIHKLLERAGLPVKLPPGLDANRMRTFMQGDKKNRGGLIRLVLLDGIGHAELRDDYRDADLQRTLEHFCSP